MLKIKMASIVSTLTVGFLVCAVDVTLWAWGGNGNFPESKTISVSPGFSLENIKQSASTDNTVGLQKAIERFIPQKSVPLVYSKPDSAQPVVPVIPAVPVLSVSGAPVASQVLTIGSQDGITVKFKVDGYEQGKGYKLGVYNDNPDKLEIGQSIDEDIGEVTVVFRTDKTELADKQTRVALIPYLKDASGKIISRGEAVNLNLEIKPGVDAVKEEPIVLDISGAPTETQELQVGSQEGVTISLKVSGYEQGKGYTVHCDGEIPDGLGMGVRQNTTNTGEEISLVFKTNDRRFADKEIIVPISCYLVDASGYVVSQTEPVNIGLEIKDFLDVRGMPGETQELTIGSEEGVRIELTATGYDKAKGYKLGCYGSDNPDSLEIESVIDDETGRIVLTFKTDNASLSGKSTSVQIIPFLLDPSGDVVNYDDSINIDFVVNASLVQKGRPVEDIKSLTAECLLSEPVKLKQNDIDHPVNVDFIVGGLPEGLSKEDLTVSWDNDHYGDIGEKKVEALGGGSYKVTVPVVYGGTAAGEQEGVVGTFDFNVAKAKFFLKADIYPVVRVAEAVNGDRSNTQQADSTVIDSSNINVLSEYIFLKGGDVANGKVKLVVSGLIESDAAEKFHIKWDNSSEGVYNGSHITKIEDNKYAFSFSLPDGVNDGQAVSGSIILSSGQEFRFSARVESNNNPGNGWVEDKKPGVVGMYGVITKNDVNAIYSQEGIEYVKVTLVSDWADPDPSINPVGDYTADSVFYIDQRMLRTGIEDGLFVNNYAAKVKLSDGTEAFGYMKASSGLLSHEKDLKTREEINTYAGVLPHWKQALELKQPFSPGVVQRPEEFPRNLVHTFFWGGLNSYDQNFINWQKDVYADVDFKEEDGLKFIQGLTASIHSHLTFDNNLQGLFGSNNAFDRNLDVLTASAVLLYNTYSNRLSKTDKLDNSMVSCDDYAIIENYMLGQQGVYSEIYFLPGHALLKVNYKGVDYAVDPTLNVVMHLSEYEEVWDENISNSNLFFSVQSAFPEVYLEGGSFYKQP